MPDSPALKSDKVQCWTEHVDNERCSGVSWDGNELPNGSEEVAHCAGST